MRACLLLLSGPMTLLAATAVRKSVLLWKYLQWPMQTKVLESVQVSHRNSKSGNSSPQRDALERAMIDLINRQSEPYMTSHLLQQLMLDENTHDFGLQTFCSSSALTAGKKSRQAMPAVRTHWQYVSVGKARICLPATPRSDQNDERGIDARLTSTEKLACR